VLGITIALMMWLLWSGKECITSGQAAGREYICVGLLMLDALIVTLTLRRVING
jgi:hypothetical protein